MTMLSSRRGQLLHAFDVVASLLSHDDLPETAGWQTYPDEARGQLAAIVMSDDDKREAIGKWAAHLGVKAEQKDPFSFADADGILRTHTTIFAAAVVDHVKVNVWAHIDEVTAPAELVAEVA